MLLDGETFDLVQHIDTFLATVVGHELETQVEAELMQSVLEIATPVCSTAGDVDRELRDFREYVASVAKGHSLRVGSSGTHPFSLFERQRITARDRYRALVDQLQYIARRELIFGMHVHVAVDDPEKAIQVVNGLLLELPPLLALSANSPFWRGEPTGLSSTRQLVFAAFPRSGPPPRFKDYGDYAEVVGQLEKTGCIADYTHIWWESGRIRGGDGRDSYLRRPDPRRARRCDRRVLPGAREDVLRAVRPRRGDLHVPPDPDEREQMARRPLRARGTLDGPRDGSPQPRPGRPARAQAAEGARPACERARLRERARGDPGHPLARERSRPPAAGLQREPRPRRGRPRDRRRDRGWAVTLNARARQSQHRTRRGREPSRPPPACRRP